MLSALILLAAVPANHPPAYSVFLQQSGNPIIEELVITGAGDREAEIRLALRLKEGRPFKVDDLRRDQEFLWRRLRVRVDETKSTRLANERIRIELVVTVVPSVSRVVFFGNEGFERDELLVALNLVGQSVDRGRVPMLVLSLEEFYQDEGYRHVKVEAEINEESSQLDLNIDEGPLVRIEKISFEGNERFIGSAFLGLGTSISAAMEAGDGVLFFPGSVYKRGIIQRDLISIAEFYRDFGYLDARAWVAEETFNSRGNKVSLRIGIYEGPLFKVRSVEFRAADGGELLLSHQELLEIVGVRPGQDYEAARFAADESALRKHYGRLGHPAAARAISSGDSFFSVGGSQRKPELVVDEDAAEVDVTYVIQEGRPMRIRDVIVKGNVHTRDRVIRREISLEPGDLADGYEATRSWRRLLGKSWFRDQNTGQPFVDWRFVETDRHDWVDLSFEVGDMASTGQFLFGGGVNTNTGPFLSVSLHKSNFDLFNTPSSWGNAFGEILDGTAFVGGGQNLSIRAAPGTQYSTYSLSFSEPDLFLDHIDRIAFGLSAYNTHLRLSTHEERRTGASVRFARHFGRDFSISLGPESTRVEVLSPASNAPAILLEDEGKKQLTGLSLGFSYNTIADPFSPVDGGRISLNNRFIGGAFGGDMDFHTSDLRLEKYFPLWNDSRGRHWVFGAIGRLRVGHESGDNDRLPYSERFFLGGHGTMRGFSYRGIGDRENGFALGGEAAWNSSLELRFPVVSTKVRGSIDEMEYVRGALWVDMGGIGDSVRDFGATRVSAGIGVRVRIPFMPQLPLALDFGWPVQSLEGDREEVFTFSMGKF